MTEINKIIMTNKIFLPAKRQKLIFPFRFFLPLVDRANQECPSLGSVGSVPCRLCALSSLLYVDENIFVCV